MPKPIDLEKQKYMFTDDIKFLQKAVVFHPEKSELFLVLKRPADAFSRPNDWDLPGGNVLFGELHEDSLRKEIREEADLEVGDLIPVQVVTNYDKEKQLYFIFNGFSSQAKSADVKISQEHVEYRWANKKEFIELRPAQFLIDLVELAIK